MTPKPIENFRFKEFTGLDTSPEADYLIASMDVMSSLESIKTIKNHALEAMNLKKGDIVLEVGCGHGEDAEVLGKIVGNTGSVMAVDLSQRMIDEAKRRSKQKNVQYLVADAHHLDYLNQSFSACHADRLLVSHENYQEFFKRILRLVKPNGTICFTDVDALSIIIYPYNPVTRIILEQTHQSFVNPYMGRSLPALFIQMGLQEVTVISKTSTVRSFETMCKIFKFSKIAEEAIKGGKLTKEEARQWEEEMHKADKKGEFIYSITFFTVLGQMPQ